MRPLEGSKEKYERRKERHEVTRKQPFSKWWFSWWPNPGDRFSFFVAVFTGGVFIATVALWIATRDLVTGAEETAERQLRAYIVETRGSVTVASDNTAINIYIELKNTGQTPAYEFSRRTGSEAIRRPSTHPLDNHLAPLSNIRVALAISRGTDRSELVQLSARPCAQTTTF